MATSAPRPTIPTLAELDLVIQTPRLRLRPFTDDDVDAIWPFVSDPAFPTAMSWKAHADPSETIAFVRHAHDSLAGGTGVTWAIEHAGVAAGCITIESIRWHLRALRVDRGEIGYWIAPPLWGQGLMTEAARAVVRYGFATIGLHKLTVGCLSDNTGSRRVIEKVGFRPVGRLEDDVWRDGRWHAHLRYELTADEWPGCGSSVP